jgi:catechol 2,3-dioxygenase-like lactoylglutathione lyase family enzyme
VGVGCIGVFVSDLRASLDFYRRLGLAIPEDAGDGSDYRLRLPTGQVFFWETYEAVQAFDPDWQPSSGSRRIVLEFGFATPEALDDKYAELTSQGYEGYLDPFTFAGSTVRIALIRDPDGNEVGMRYPEC